MRNKLVLCYGRCHNARCSIAYPITGVSCHNNRLHSRATKSRRFACTQSIQKCCIAQRQSHFFVNPGNYLKKAYTKNPQYQKRNIIQMKSGHNKTHKPQKECIQPQFYHFRNKGVELQRRHAVPPHQFLSRNLIRFFAFQNSVNQDVPKRYKSHKATQKYRQFKAMRTEGRHEDSKSQRNQKNPCSIIEIGETSLFAGLPRGQFQFLLRHDSHLCVLDTLYVKTNEFSIKTRSLS